MVEQPRILHLSSLNLSRGGIETFLAGITEGLSNRYTILVASGGNQSFNARIHNAGGYTIRWTANSALDLTAYFDFLKLLTREQPDLIHIHDSRAGWISRLALVARHLPIIMTAHLPSYYYRWARFSQLRRSLYAIMEGMLNRLATTKVVYPSLSGYEYALKRKITPAHKALYIPNGIDIDKFSINSSESISFREQMGVEPGQPVICALGRLSIEKNFSLLIQAFMLIQERYPDARLWIVGDGPERNNLELQARSGEAIDRVRFLGGRTNVGLILSACDVFSLASWYEGGRSLSVMEAQASGKPCVVSKVGDLPQMVEDGVHGFVFPEGDVKACAYSIEKLLNDDSLRNEMGHNARQKAMQDYRLEEMIQRYDLIYKAIL